MFANRADSDQAAPVRAALSGSTLFPYGNYMSDLTKVDLKSNFLILSIYITTWKFIFINIYSRLSLA